jgi:Kef-type K+ transport system membrane component KefB
MRASEPEPLTPVELERLRRRERQTAAFHAAAVGVLLLIGLGAYRYGDVAWFRGLFLALVAALAAAAALVQVRERCPRCGARLRSKLLLALPEKCTGCGVSFQRAATAQHG